MDLDVKGILTDIAEAGAVTNQHLYNLLAYFCEHPKQFVEQMELCYLKIMKYFSSLSKVQRRLFDSQTEKVFGYFVKVWVDDSSKHASMRINDDEMKGLLKYFLDFFASGLESSFFLTRVCCGRNLFMILKCLNQQLLNHVLEEKGYETASKLLNNTVGLFRCTKVQKNGKTQKGLAVKLGSYLQHIKAEESRSKQSVKASLVNLKSEMVRTICEEEKKELRLDALTNIELSESTLPYILQRIRDVEVGIRLQVFKKLIKNKLNLAELKLCDLYLVMHDGLKNISPDVRKQCQTYVLQQFYLFREQKENLFNQQPQSMLLEGEIEINYSKSGRKKMSLPAPREDLLIIRESLKGFLSIFQIERTLLFPKLYEAIGEVVKTLIVQYRAPEEFALYFKDLLKHRMKSASSVAEVAPQEIFMLKVLCNMLNNTEERAGVPQQLVQIIEHDFLDGVQLADFVKAVFDNSLDLFHLYETLQLTHSLINCDEAGRNTLLSVIKEFVLRFKDVQSIKPDMRNAYFNDVYEKISQEQIDCRWFSQHHFEQTIVRSFYDLILPATKVIKKLITFNGTSNAFYVYTYQIFHEIRLAISGFSEEIESQNLHQQKKRLQVKLQVQEEHQAELNEQLNQLKKLKKSDQYQLVGKLIDDNLKYLNHLQQSISDVDKQTEAIDIHSLYLMDALLNQCDMQALPEEEFVKLKNSLMTLSIPYLENNTRPRARQVAFRCLAYIPLYSQEQCNTVITIFTQILYGTLDKIDGLYQDDDIIVITSLKCVLDVMLCFDIEEQELDTRRQLTEVICLFATKSRGVVQQIALEGMTKLLLHQKVSNPQTMISLLLFIWFDKSIEQIALQLVTTFFKCYITSSLNFLEVFEKGLEVYICICCYLNSSKNVKLNNVYLQTDHWSENKIMRVAVVGMKMMHYSAVKSNPTYSDLKARVENDQYLGPQEQYIAFLCKLIFTFNNLFINNILSEVLKNSDFMDNYDVMNDKDDLIPIDKTNYQIVSKYLLEAIAFLENNSQNVQPLKDFLARMTDQVGNIQSKQCDQGFVSQQDSFQSQKQIVNQLSKMFREEQIIIADDKQTRDKDISSMELARLNQLQDSDEPTSDNESSLNQNQPRKRKLQPSDDEEQQQQLSNQEDQRNKKQPPAPRKKRPIKK